MTNKLKSCPFCGRRPELEYDDDGFAYIVCANDGCYVKTDGHSNADAAIKAWNTRKPIDKVIEQLEAGIQKMCETICVDDGYEQEIYDAYRQGIYDAFTEAIEIVKGGVE